MGNSYAKGVINSNFQILAKVPYKKSADGASPPALLHTSSPATPRRRRGWRWRRRRWWHAPVMRWRRRRRRHPPMVAVVMMMVMMRDHAAIHVSSGERDTGKCDCGEGRDEFDLVHGMVPFFVIAQAHSRAYKKAGRSAGTF